MLKDLGAVLQNDQDVVLSVVIGCRSAFRYASSSLQSNRDFAITMVSRNGKMLQFVHGGFQNDHEVVLAAVTQCGAALQYASVEILHRLYCEEILVYLSISVLT